MEYKDMKIETQEAALHLATMASPLTSMKYGNALDSCGYYENLANGINAQTKAKTAGMIAESDLLTLNYDVQKKQQTKQLERRLTDLDEETRKFKIGTADETEVTLTKGEWRELDKAKAKALMGL